MSHKQKSWFGHHWETDGYNGLLTIRQTCNRCGLHRYFNGALDEWFQEQPCDEADRG